MRTLRRPMFRRGGSTGEGITSGLSRQGYKEAGDVQPRRPNPNLNNFLIVNNIKIHAHNLIYYRPLFGIHCFI